MTILPVTTAASATLSNGIATPGQLVGLQIPNLSSASVIYIQASIDGVNFSRVLLNDGSGSDWSIPSTSGNRFIFLDNIAVFPFLAVEMATTQSTATVFNFILK